MGMPSIAPEKLLRAVLMRILYTIRSERMRMEQLDYNLLVRWFVGLNMDDGVWDRISLEAFAVRWPAEKWPSWPPFQTR